MDEKYYIKNVDKHAESVYCHHDLMGELLVPTHVHEKAQMLYTEGGIVFVKTQTKKYYLPARHFMWIPAGVKHSLHPSSENVMMRNLYFPIAEQDDTFYLTEGIYPVKDLLLEMILFTNRWNGDIFTNTRNFAIVMGIKAILPDLCKVNLPLALPYPKDFRLMDVIHYIDVNIENTLLLSEIAFQFQFTTKTLSRLFKKELNMTFVQYLTIKRILKFIELTLDKNYSIQNAALAIGYKSTPTFSNTFYKFMGQRPSDYLNGRKVLQELT
jgi:AraC-like DNA-binding protein